MKTLEISLKNPKIETAEFEVAGLSPLIVQNWSPLKGVRCSYGRKPRSPKEMVFERFLESLYIVDRKKLPRRPIGAGESLPFIKGAFGIPPGMLRRALFTTARLLKEADRIGTVSVPDRPSLLPIRYSRLVCHAEHVRIGIGPNKVHDVRIRGRFEGWSVRLKVKFDSNRISQKQILLVLRAAGRFAGIGAWRPEMNSDYGRFTATAVMKSV